MRPVDGSYKSMDRPQHLEKELKERPRAGLDKVRPPAYNNRTTVCKTRACTGFDGGFEVAEAIRGPGPRKNLDLKLNADDNLALAA